MTYNDVCFVIDKEPVSKEILLQQCSRYDVWYTLVFAVINARIPFMARWLVLWFMVCDV